MTAGPRGPMLMQDTVYQDEMAHFDRERIPERVVHAKGGGYIDIYMYMCNCSYTNVCICVYVSIVLVACVYT